MSKDRNLLIELYRRMAELTLPVCGTCRTPYNCCHPAICLTVIDWAQSKWGVTLEPTGHERLPLMGPLGCIAEPHLRPVCAVHCCPMVEHGEKPGDMDWTRAYAELLAQIKEIEDPKEQILG
jgi:hypothetical protein